MFLLTLMLLVSIWPMVLFYHSIITSYYALRSAASGNGTFCGTFYICASTAAGNTGWIAGATLLLTSYYARRGGLSSLGDFCGISFVALYDKADAARWVFGTALSFITSYYPIRGGVSSAGEYNGIFYVHMAFNASTSYWPYGAVLLLLHIMLFVLTVLMVIFVVEFI